MAATRLLRMSKPLGLGFSQQVLSKSDVSRPKVLVFLSKAGQCSENPPGGSGGERKPLPVKAAVNALACVVVEPRTEKEVDLGLVLENVSDVMSDWVKFISKNRLWRRFHLQKYIEKVTSCKIFSLTGHMRRLLVQMVKSVSFAGDSRLQILYVASNCRFFNRFRTVFR